MSADTLTTLTPQATTHEPEPLSAPSDHRESRGPSERTIVQRTKQLERAKTRYPFWELVGVEAPRAEDCCSVRSFNGLMRNWKRKLYVLSAFYT